MKHTALLRVLPALPIFLFNLSITTALGATDTINQTSTYSEQTKDSELYVTQKQSKKHRSSSYDQFYETYIANKLTIGTRFTYHYLTDSDSGAKGGTQGEGTYLGTIYALDEEQNYLPVNFYANYFFSKYIGLELAYDTVEAETVATSIGYDTIKSDGDITLYGPTLSVVGRYPNDTLFTPYVSVGLGYYFGDFEESTHWGLGYSDPTQWEALGSPTTNYNGKSREMVIDDSIGIVAALGCSYRLRENIAPDLSVQYTKVEADATFYGYNDGVLTTEQDGSFPVDNLAFRAGISYTF